MSPNLLLTIQLINSAGVPISYKQIYPQSLVQGFIALLACQFLGTYTTLKDITNNNRGFYPYAQNFSILADIGNDTQGIVAGTDATAVAITNYKLGTRIAHGTAATQLQYGVQEMLTPFTQSGSDAYFEFRRTLTNNSGSTIVLKEVGVYTQFYASYLCCVERTLVDQSIPNTNGATLTYKVIKTI